MRIFDPEKVADLVKSWKETRSNDILNSILVESTPLATYIAKNYNSEDTEDLVQNALLKIITCLDHYNPDVSNVHTYFSTVIRNSCITHYVKTKTYMSAESVHLDDIENSAVFQSFDNSEQDDCDEKELILRNMERFPSLKDDIIAEATRTIYRLTRDGMKNKSRGIVSTLVKKYGLSRTYAKTVYRSTIIFMRMQNISNSSCKYNDKLIEMSIMPELREFLGEESYGKFICVFSGTSINIR